jgi:hypothetical protein
MADLDDVAEQPLLRTSLASLQRAIKWLTLVILVSLVIQLVPLVLQLVHAVRRKPTSEPVASPSAAPAKPATTVTRDSGGSVRTPLGYGIVLNKESSLAREWVTLHDPAMPADLIGTVGLRTVYRGEYRYETGFTLQARADLSAIEVRFLTFDVWGDHVRTLSMPRIADLAPGESRMEANWSLSENEASAHYASIAYIARIRTKSGRVIEAKADNVMDEAKRLSATFTQTALEPSKPVKK